MEKETKIVKVRENEGDDPIDMPIDKITVLYEDGTLGVQAISDVDNEEWEEFYGLVDSHDQIKDVLKNKGFLTLFEKISYEGIGGKITHEAGDELIVNPEIALKWVQDPDKYADQLSDFYDATDQIKEKLGINDEDAPSFDI